MRTYEKAIPKIKDKIVKEIKPEKIILFGSYAWGKPNEDSDIDLFIIKNTKEKPIDRARKIREIIFDSGVPIDVLVYTPEEMKKSINENRNLFIEDIARNGKIIYEKSKNMFGVVFPERPLNILH